MIYNEYCLILFRKVNLRKLVKSVKGRFVNSFKNNSYTSVITFQSILCINDITEELYTLKQKFLLFKISTKTFFGNIDSETNTLLFSQLDIFNPKNFDFILSDEERLKNYIQNEEYEKAALLHKKIKKKKDENK